MAKVNTGKLKNAYVPFEQDQDSLGPQRAKLAADLKSREIQASQKVIPKDTHDDFGGSAHEDYSQISPDDK